MKKRLKLHFNSLKSFDLESLLFSKLFWIGCFAFFFLVAGQIAKQAIHIKEEVDMARIELESLKMNIARIMQDHSVRDALYNRLEKSDPHYLSYAVEGQLPFESEYNLLEEVISFSAFNGFLPIQSRLSILHEGEGAFSLNLVEEDNLLGILESRHELCQPVLINESNIKKLLASVEGRCIDHISPPMGRPDLFFSRFSLSKVADSTGREAYEMDYEVVRRDRDLR